VVLCGRDSTISLSPWAGAGRFAGEPACEVEGPPRSPAPQWRFQGLSALAHGRSWPILGKNPPCWSCTSVRLEFRRV